MPRGYRLSERPSIAKRVVLYRDPEYHKRWKLMKKFGITLEDYTALLAKQGGLCALCGGVDITRALAVDHCHETGKVRGLLCLQCNTALGRLGDTPAQLAHVLSYLNGEL